ncbi:BT_3928 family protein [Chitinophaga sp. GCM10012297]|uniref:DoxX family protein n=1 Tax=Chitinophaga chungangae TaxID=2821488 RepID=A0ABS3YI20_9BACT|nr:BT_3928 family protein [Chitinophaga chungangae]MBO9154336.1 DoxX family protein [Chitinophaga chungangae]
MKPILILFRILVGVLFIFSGLIKANDPLGLSYKMDEFFEVLHLHFLIPASLAFSLVMNAFEIIAGFAVLLGYRMRFFSFLLLILIIFFTFLTGFALFSGLIRECGCFGDCIKLTADQSFYKDLILLVMILVIFIYHKRIKPAFPTKATNMLMALAVLFPIALQWYTLAHLPIVDCLPYKVGNNIMEKMKVPPGSTPDVYETVLIYEKNGQQQEFTTENYPWQDTLWKFVDRKDKLVKKGNAEPAIKDFVLTDFDGVNMNRGVLMESLPVYLFLVRDVREAGSGWEKKMQALQQQFKEGKFMLFGVTSSNKAQVEQFQKERGIDFQFLQMDGTAIKTAGRSTPCLLLLEKSVVKGKWHYNDIPDFTK